MPEIDLNALVTTVSDVVAAWGIRVLGAIALLFAGWVVAGWIRRAVRKAMTRTGSDETLVPFMASLAYYLALAVVLIAVLGLIGIQTAPLVAVLGAAGLAVGLAMQGTLSNFAAGVMLLVLRPFKAGDFIDAGGTAGSVYEVGVFFTTLNTPDHVRVVVPNGAVWGQTIRNYAVNPTRRLDMVMSIAYDDDIETALATIRDALASDERVLEDPAPTVVVGELAASSVDILVRPWCKREDYWPLRWDLTHRLKDELEAAGCSIPFPQRDIHVIREEAAA